jgi:hypothetical protein
MFVPEFYYKKTKLLSLTKKNARILTQRVVNRAIPTMNTNLIIPALLSLTEVEMEQVNQLRGQLEQLEARLRVHEQQTRVPVQQQQQVAPRVVRTFKGPPFSGEGVPVIEEFIYQLTNQIVMQGITEEK